MTARLPKNINSKEMIMSCPKCSKEASGNFCSHCGEKLFVPEAIFEQLSYGFDDEINYTALLLQPEVNILIGHYASQHKPNISGEEYLKIYDKIHPPFLTPSKTWIIEKVHPIAKKIGLKTSKNRQEFFQYPVKRVFLSVICSMARYGQQINEIEQKQDGCLVSAIIPSDVWSFAGTLMVNIQKQDLGTSVKAATLIKGQLYDWGKSKLVLANLFDDIINIPYYS